MKSRIKTKKTLPKKEAVKKSKEPLAKEDVKEIVEETVEEILKKQEDADISAESHVSEKETSTESHSETAPTPSSDVSSPTIQSEVTNDSEKEKTLDETSMNPALKPSSAHNAVSVVSPEAVSEAKEEASVVSSTPSIEPVTSTTTEVSSSFTGNPIAESPKKSPFRGILIALCAFLLAAGGGFWYLTSHNTIMTKLSLPGFAPTPKPTLAIKRSPTPTTTPATVDVSSYKVSVLNGSGVAGEAAKVKTLLTGSGFTVDNTGNATSSDFTQTVISAKASVSQNAVDKLTQVLSGEYTVSTHPVTLSNSDPEDIVVTVGAAK